MREVVIPQTAIEEYKKGVIMHFPKNKYDNCRWSKNLSTWQMLKNRYDNGNRDSQLNKLYNAEYSLIPWADENSMDFGEVIVKIAEIVNDTWFRKRFGRLFSETELKVEYASPNQNMAYSFGSDFLSFPPQFCNVPIILHELSHTILDRLSYVVHFKKDYATHGRMFAFTYLELVKKYMGTREYTILKTGYKNFRVKYHNRIPQTPSEKKILREKFTNSVLNKK